LKQFRIPLPALAEQERIVKLLDEADELRKLRAQADRRTAALIPSLFHEMRAEAEERNCPWPKTTLADLCSRVVDCPHATPTYATSETLYACVRSSDIQEGKLDWSSTKYVDESEYAKRVKVLVPRPGDVVFCREGARLGNAALVTNGKEVCLGQRMMLFQ
jgi:type I restriction enzyme S subunit